MSMFVYGPDQVPPFTMESSCGVAGGISDMLVQGWNDVLRIFPAVPDHWQDVAFETYAPKGFYRLGHSAKRENRLGPD